MFASVRFIICFLLYMRITCQPTPSGNGTKGSEINGQTLFQFGRKYNQPLLSVIGRAILNIQPCTEWTQWSNCPVTRPGVFAVTKRTRKCGKIKGSLEELSTNIESDFTFCEGRCPTDYNFTSNGFCMKLYLEKKNNEDAELMCKKDRGHLINIDTDQKYGDVKGILTEFSPNINIGGRRENSYSPWQYRYGSQDGFFVWYSGYPTSNLCLALSNPRLFYDHGCNVEYPFICEIPL